MKRQPPKDDQQVWAELWEPLFALAPDSLSDHMRVLLASDEASGVLAWGVRSGYLLWVRTHPGEKATKALLAEWFAKANAE